MAATTEADIKRAIRPLLDLFGELTTSELIELIPSAIKLTDEDLQVSQSRNGERLYKQIIRNIASHQSEALRYYS